MTEQKENLKKMLLTLGIISSMEHGNMIEKLNEQFDVAVVEKDMIEWGNSFDGMENEDSIAMAFEILAEIFPNARRSSEDQDQFLQTR